MTFDEIDWRIEPLHDVIVGIEAGLRAIQQRMEEEEGFDGLFAQEHADSVLGLGLVAAQTYILGAWTDLNRLRVHAGQALITKSQCYASDTITIMPAVTRIQLINAAANYFKHHDEWSDWPSNETTQILGRVGITKNTDFPCVNATRMLCGETCELIVMHQIVREWRAHIFRALR